ncbi:ribosomal protein S18-alanine N-acetyltransferase [Conchiformibius steedae DSM 2580]|uniref:[Ribosomal protein bS18]-alanine N-acetyltransferase n=1 Tax=Conchiformibius steedae DSM 2580 TaxID=1121352 RepID=A0AAE9HTZ6_9NEIS|nr:ribosomal protein S18-alanine N-acetyltransferase [Conchiformibius steedae]QMT33500.1 ribosomal protein S18-alanine N-acetyltransferase [Conchiformibius steedae]URD68157.1 ribosomal protein S18-alanine N-acetyltransferase [Conchiformibius steedae DSM 2580]
MLRLAGESDLPDLAALDGRSRAHAWTAAQFADSLNAPHTQIWLAEQDGQTVGLAVWQTVCGETELHLIVTDPAWRRRGLASRLLAKLLDETAAQGGNRVLLEVAAGNAAAQALYYAHGFVVMGRRTQYYADGEDAVLMEKIW